MEKGKDPKRQNQVRGEMGEDRTKIKNSIKSKDGGSIVILFECNLCMLRKLKGENPRGK